MASKAFRIVAVAAVLCTGAYSYASFLEQLLAERNLFLAEQNLAALSAGVFQAEVGRYRAP